MKKLALNNEAVEALRSLADTLDEATSNIVEAYDVLNQYFCSNTKAYGVHAEDFDAIIKKASKAAEIATVALTDEVRAKFLNVADAIEAYISAHPQVGMSAMNSVLTAAETSITIENQLRFNVSGDGKRASLDGVNFVLMERNDGGREFVFDTPTVNDFKKFEANKSDYTLLNGPDEFGERSDQGYVFVDPKAINAVLGSEQQILNNDLDSIWNHVEAIGDTGNYSAEAIPNRFEPTKTKPVLRVDAINIGYEKYYCLHENIGYRELYGFVKSGKEICVEVVDVFKTPMHLR